MRLVCVLSLAALGAAAVGCIGSTGQSEWSPVDLAVGTDGNLYVTGTVCVRGFGLGCAEGSYGGVWVFSPAGRRLRYWRTYGDDVLQGVDGIAIGSSGDVYVARPDALGITRYDPDGAFIADLVIGRHPADVAFDGSGNWYVCYSDGTWPPIGRFAPDGSAVADWPGDQTGVPDAIHRVVVEPSGTLLVTQFYRGVAVTGLVYRLGTDGALVTSWGDSVAGLTTAVATDAAGNVYGVSIHSGKVTKYAHDGAVLAQWGAIGEGPNQYDGAKAIAIDSSGSMYVSDEDNQEITKFSPTGEVLLQFGASGA